jgi:mRNA-degrading endonuclease RelE of RelBE toxin-antitoxin system
MSAKTAPFAIVYAEEVKQHLRGIDPKHHSFIRSQTEEQLLYQPTVETKNRKPLQRAMASGAEWELRLGPRNRFRVFYQVDLDRHEVKVFAIGVKERNRLTIGGEEVGK